MQEFQLLLAAGGQRFRVRLGAGISLAIEQTFDAAQPRHFFAPPAEAVAWESGGFCGDTRRGGSCNVDRVSVIPHCNGTHTETVGHIVSQRVAAGSRLLGGPLVARLVTVEPVAATGCGEGYVPEPETGDRVITASALMRAVDAPGEDFPLSPIPTAWIVRTLPNDLSKKTRDYSGGSAPYFTHPAIVWLLDRGVEHLLVDLPSIDRMQDGGRMSNHCLFWDVDPASRQMKTAGVEERTVTELVFVPQEVVDGVYLLDLQVPAWGRDAAPSRPVIFPLEASDGFADGGTAGPSG